MGVCNRHYTLYVRICERMGLQPIPQEKCTIQLIQAVKLVADSYYGTNIKNLEIIQINQPNNHEAD